MNRKPSALTVLLLALAAAPACGQSLAAPLDAAALLREMVSAHGSLDAFHVVVETSATDAARAKSRTTVRFQAPNLARVEAAVGKGTSIAASDGRTLAAALQDTGDKKHVEAAPLATRAVIGQALELLDRGLPAAGIAGKGSGVGPLRALLQGEDPLAVPGHRVVALSLGPAGVVDRVPVDVLEARLAPERGPRVEAIARFEIGRSDRLLRRLTFGPAGTSQRVATVTQTLTWQAPAVAEPLDFRLELPEGSAASGGRRRRGEPIRMLLGAGVIAAALAALLRRWDVRLALVLAALAMGVIAGEPMAVVRKFFASFSDEKYVVPICSAMGFAYVLGHTGCDRHLVYLLTHPLRRIRLLLIPGAVLVGFLVNIPVISQSSTAVAIGSVMIPLLLAARVSPLTAGGALLIGASIGGELFNPGAPEYRTIIDGANEFASWGAAWSLLPVTLDSAACITRTLLPNLAQLTAATLVFWLLSRSHEAAYVKDPAAATEAPPDFRVHPFKAAIPLVPLALLFLVGGTQPKPTQLITLPQEWLVDSRSKLDQLNPASTFDSRLIGAAMLVGVILAAASARDKALGVARAFFDGAGYAFTHVIAIIVAAACFAEGVALIGIAELLRDFVTAVPALLVPLAGAVPLLFAAVSGSGIASTQGLYEFFGRPAWGLGIDPALVGSVVALASAAGRTMSPVAAVVLMSARLTDTDPIDLVKRVLPPVLAGAAAMVLTAMLLVR